MLSVATNPSLPVTLRPSPLKWLLVLLIGLVFVAMGFVMIKDHGSANQVMDLTSIGFFGLVALVAFLNLIPGASYLRLDKQGFEMRALYRTIRVAWSDVSGFGIVRIEIAKKDMVGWNYVLGRGKPSRLRKFNFGKFGFEASLPDTYGMSAQDLSDLLESIRRRQSAND